MRILHVDTGTGWRGGQQQVLWLLEGCRELGIEQRLAAPAGSPLAERASQSGISVCEISPRAVSLENARRLRRLVSECDVAHAHDAHGHTLLWAACGYGTAALPVVVSRRVGFRIGPGGRRKYRFPALYIAVSQFVRWRLIDGGVPEQRVRVVFDGVKVPVELPGAALREEFRLRQDADEGSFVLGTLSSFAAEKRLPELLSLLEQLPAPVQLWLGVPHGEPDPGDVGPRLLEAARQRGLAKRFRIVPVGEHPGRFLAALDVFVYLSRMEGLGSAILLAMAHQLPVVASDVGGIPEIVRHGQTGVLVGADAAGDLPPAVRFLMGSPQIRRRLGTAAREFVFAHASSDRMVAQTVLLYQELGQGSREPRA